MIHVSVPQDEELDCVVVTVVVRRRGEDTVAWFLTRVTEIVEEYERGNRPAQSDPGSDAWLG